MGPKRAGRGTDLGNAQSAKPHLSSNLDSWQVGKEREKLR